MFVLLAIRPVFIILLAPKHLNCLSSVLQNNKMAAVKPRSLPAWVQLGLFLSPVSPSFHPLIKHNKVASTGISGLLGRFIAFFLLMRHFHFEGDLCSFNWKMKVNWVFFKSGFRRTNCSLVEAIAVTRCHRNGSFLQNSPLLVEDIRLPKRSRS